jgi:ribosomal-protein-alanine N-acetyltransferase
MSAVLKPQPLVRALTEADLPAVMAIEKSIYPYPWTLGNFRDSLAAGYCCRAWELEGELIGYAVLMLAADEAHLLNLSVAAAWQGRGYGGRFLLQLMDIARVQHAGLMFLEVRPSNAGGRRLYERHGFQHIGVRRDYYPAQDGREDALILSLPL